MRLFWSWRLLLPVPAVMCSPRFVGLWPTPGSPSCVSSSANPYPVHAVPSRHVGENHLVALRQTLEHLDGVDGRAAQAHTHPHALLAARDELKEAHRAPCLALGGATHEQRVRDALDLD